MQGTWLRERSRLANPAAPSLRYSDIVSVSEKDVYSAAYQWRPTGPDAIRIRTKMFDGAISLERKEVFYEELLKRNPSIEITRKA